MSDKKDSRKTSLQKRIKSALKSSGVKEILELDFDIHDYPYPSSELAEIDTVRLRKLMGIYTGYYGHLNTVLANSKIERDSKRKFIRAIEQKFSVKNQDEKRWVVKANIENDKDWIRLNKELESIEGEIRVIEAQRDTYEHYYKSLSRELSARDNEFEFFKRGQ